MAHSFEGVFAALTTPFHKDEIDYEGLKENISRYDSFALSGYVVLGSTAEAILLDDDESEKVVRTAVAASSSPSKKVIVGTSRESTRRTVEFTRRMAGLGATAVLVRNPGYYKSRMDREALRAYFLAVADSADIPLILYNIPQNTGVAIENALTAELSRHPRIAAVKDSSGILANVVEVLPSAAPDFDYLLGAGSVLLAGLTLGANGAILAVADAAPGLCVKLYDLFREGKLEGQTLQGSIQPN